MNCAVEVNMPKIVTLDQLPISAADQRTLFRTAGIRGALYVEDKAVVWGPDCTLKTEAEALDQHPDATLIWRRVAVNRVALGLALMEVEGITAHAAAQRVGVEPSAIYRAQKLREERGVCPTCNQVLPA